MQPNRRQFIERTFGGGLLLGGGLSFLSQLKPVSAAEAQLDPSLVRIDSGIEKAVRLLEETPQERLLEEVATHIKGGLSYREVLAALLLAGVRNVQPSKRQRIRRTNPQCILGISVYLVLTSRTITRRADHQADLLGLPRL